MLLIFECKCVDYIKYFNSFCLFVARFVLDVGGSRWFVRWSSAGAVGLVWCRLFSVVLCFCCRVCFVSSVAVRLPPAGFCLC